MTMQELIAGFAHQLRLAVEHGKGISLTAPQHEIRNVLVAGLGGSGIGGSIAEQVAYFDCTVPITVSKSYDVPAFADKHTLFVASSFSGSTEETLAALQTAQKAGCKVVAITTGGPLAAEAQKHGFDLVQFKGLAASPRAHLPFSFVLLMLTLKGYGLVSQDYAAQALATAELLDKENNDILDQARALANATTGKLPVLYSDTKLGPACVRALQQITENGKQLAHVNVFPEMNHNELVGWKKGEDVLKNAVVVLVRTDYDHPRVRLRMDICEKIFAEYAPVIRLNAKGDSLFAQTLYVIYLLDWTSFFIAENNGVDPFPVDVIMYLKNELAKV